MVRNKKIPIVILLLTCSACLANAGADDKSRSLSDLTTQALHLSRLNQAGNPPFHLKAVVSAPGNRNSGYKAEIEEDWVAPDKWRRTIKSPGFSQALTVNGDRVAEVNSGDYYPFWLRDTVIAIFDMIPQDLTPDNLPLPMAVNKPAPAGSCSRWEEKVGLTTPQNNLFSTVCFFDLRLLSAVSVPFYNARFEEYADFKHKEVSRVIKVFLQEGTIIEAKVAQLNELRRTDDTLFMIPQPTLEKERIYSARTGEADARKLLLDSPEIVWSPVRGGKTSGTMTIAVYVDKHGAVRETRPLNADNIYAQDQARKVVSQWHFKPLEQNGGPVQMETLLTFTFQTTTSGAVPVLSDDQARKLAINKPDATFSSTRFAKGMEYAVRIYVNDRGRITNVENVNNLDATLFAGATTALSLWSFRPYMQNGKPQEFQADLTLHVK
jgi:hypothetical protein